MSNDLTYKWYDAPVDPTGSNDRREEDWRWAGESFDMVFERGAGSTSVLNPGDTIKVVIAPSETDVAIVPPITATVAGDGLSFTAAINGTLTRPYAGRFSVLAWNETRSTALAQDILALHGNQLFAAGDVPSAFTGFLFGITTGYRVATNADLNGLLDDDAAASRAALGLGSSATHAASDFDAAGAAAAAQAASQPADSDLTAIAVLSTTTFGRALLTLANAGALATAAGVGTGDSPTFAGLELSGNLTAVTASLSGNLTAGGGISAVSFFSPNLHWQLTDTYASFGVPVTAPSFNGNTIVGGTGTLTLDTFTLTAIRSGNIATTDDIADLVASSPAALDTLKELADALGDDPVFSATVSTALGNRVRVDTAAQGLNGTQKTNAKTNIDLQNVDNTSDATKNAATVTLTNKTLNSPAVTGVIETGVNLSSTMSGTVTANYQAGDYQYGTISGAVTLVFSNPPASGSVGTLTLELTGDGSHGITWPGSVDWGTAGAPSTLGAGSCTIFTFVTRNAGTKWRAAYVGGFA